MESYHEIITALTELFLLIKNSRDNEMESYHEIITALAAFCSLESIAALLPIP